MKLKLRKKSKDNKDWFYEIEPEPKIAKEISESFQSAFHPRTIVVDIIDIIFSLLVSMIINDPLVALAHFLRTGTWSYATNLTTFIVFILLLLGIVLVAYLVSKPIRKAIKEDILRQRNKFYTRLISIMFAFLIIDLVFDGLLLVADIITQSESAFDLGFMVDRIIASFILLLIYLIIYSIARKRGT